MCDNVWRGCCGGGYFGGVCWGKSWISDEDRDRFFEGVVLSVFFCVGY